MTAKKKKVIKKKSKSKKAPKATPKSESARSKKIAPHFDTQDRSAETNSNVEVPLSEIPDSLQTNSRPRK